MTARDRHEAGYMMPVDAFRRIFTKEQREIIMPHASLFGEFIQWRMVPLPLDAEVGGRHWRLINILYRHPREVGADDAAMAYPRRVCAGDHRPRVPVDYIGTPHTGDRLPPPANDHEEYPGPDWRYITIVASIAALLGWFVWWWPR